jgi:hypothetical protein
MGLWSAARLFANAAWDAGGAAAVRALDEDLGGDYPVVEEVVRRVLAAGKRLAPPGAAAVVARCEGLRRLVVVGVEADLLGGILERLPPATEVIALFDSTFPVDAARVQASWTPRVRLEDVGSFQQAAGARSGLLTAAYGADEVRAVVAPVWLRVHSPDVRLLFRRLIGMDLVGGRMAGYPRWLGETPRDDFTDMVDVS